MAKRKPIRRKQTKKSNSFVIFLIVVIILAIISFIVSYMVLNTEQEAMEKAVSNDSIIVTTDKETAQELSAGEKAVIAHLQGTWVSNYDGTMLTIKGEYCTFESAAVDAAEKITGRISISESLITFIFDQRNSCGSAEGHYQYMKEGDEEIFFKKVKDPCLWRSDLMTTSWFRL